MKADKDSRRHQVVRTILIRFLRDKDYCPSCEYTDIDYTLLFRTAGANKVEHALLHMLQCRTCRKRIYPGFLKRLTQLDFRLRALSLLRQAELKKLNMVLFYHHIRTVLFKDYPGRLRVGGDIDILISTDNLRRLSPVLLQEGYTKTERVAYKEHQFISPRNRFKIDAHHLIAYPQYGELDRDELCAVRRYTQDLLYTTGTSFGITHMTRERYIFTRFFHYWYNDMLCGLYPLFELCAFCYRYRRRIRWNEVLRLADEYAMRNEFIYVLLIGENMFDIPLPDPIRHGLSFRIRLVASAITADDIIFFPPISRWHHKQYRTVAHGKYLRYLFTKLLLNTRTPPLRLLRFRIIGFVLRGLLLCAVRRLTLKKEGNKQKKFSDHPVQ